jgi:hypothetical protein
MVSASLTMSSDSTASNSSALSWKLANTAPVDMPAPLAMSRMVAGS